MTKIAQTVNDRQRVIADLLQRADKLSSQGEKLGACCCIEAVFMLYGPEPEEYNDPAEADSRSQSAIVQF